MVKTFQTPTGAKEIFFAGTSVFNLNFKVELEDLLSTCLASSKTKPVWMRFHLSDIANQGPIIYDLLKDNYRYTLVGQGPTNLSHIALEAYWIEENSNSKITKEISQFSSTCHLQNYTLSYFAKDFTNEVGSCDETNAEFEYVRNYLAKNNSNIYNNLLRTWIYCRDIDNNYAGLVKARRELFTEENLTANTHYIASTGIEALSYPFNRLVTMDNFMLVGHKEEQVIYLKALENLSPTAIYGVTFERATKIEEVNLNYGLRFPTNRKPYKDPPKPISLSSFIFRYKLRFKEAKAFYTYPNINEETNEIMYNPLIDNY